MLHLLILFTVLSCLYVFYISNVERDAFRSEITNNLTDRIPDLLREYDTDGTLKRSLSNLRFDAIKSAYSGPNDTTSIYNSWLKRTMILVVVVLGILFLVSFLWLKFSCNQCVDIWAVIRQNVIIFAIVGGCEFIFFWFIAAKYVPAPPSLIVNRTLDDLKNGWTL